MEFVRFIATWIVGLGIMNVWLIRRGMATSYRAGAATTMREEFAVYGLPVWFMCAIGTVKVTLALALLVGTWQCSLVQPAASAMAVLMGAAVLMHVKVKDTFKKTAPSVSVLALCLLIIFS